MFPHRRSGASLGLMTPRQRLILLLAVAGRATIGGAPLAAQVTAFAPTQAPASQVSLWVQALPSLHAVPSGAAGFVHRPVVTSQAPPT